jgi:hypothetical protein
MAKPTDIVKTASMTAAILAAGTATAVPDAQPKTEAQAPNGLRPPAITI